MCTEGDRLYVKWPHQWSVITYNFYKVNVFASISFVLVSIVNKKIVVLNKNG